MDDSELNFELREFPPDCQLIGDYSEEETIKIYIVKNILQEIDDYLAGETDRELGGVLIGNAFKNEAGELFVIIDNFIIARNTKSDLTRLTFTPETWENINFEKENYHNDKIMLGWFHSHPGHKVFLSSYDIFIQENFFNNIYNIAYVYDPVIAERGFFAWNGNKIIKTGHYCIINDNLFNIDNPKEKGFKMIKKSGKNGNSSGNIKFGVIAFLLILNIIITLLYILDYHYLKADIENVKEYFNSVKIIKNDIEKIDLKVNEILLNQMYDKDTSKILKDSN